MTTNKTKFEFITDANSDSTIPYLELTFDKVKDVKNLKSFKNKRVIMIGEAHDEPYYEWFIEEAMKLFNPDYFLTEHTQYLNVKPGEFLTRLDNLGKDGLPYNKYTKRWLTIGMKYDIEFIGMDWCPPDNNPDTFADTVYGEVDDLTALRKSFKLRERAMLDNLIKYSKLGKVLLQVGDTHMRTTDNATLGISPLAQYGISNAKSIGMFRLPQQYQEAP